MKEIFEWISKQKLSAIFLIASVLFIFLSIFEVKDLTKLQFLAWNPPVYLGFFSGVLLLFLSLAMIVADQGIGPIVLLTKTKKIENGYGAKIYNSELRVIFDRIENITISSATEKPGLFVLPANEYFDDECVLDQRTSLGAYINRKFESRKDEIRSDIKSQRGHLKSCGEREKEHNVKSVSYGVGTGLLIESIPAGSDLVLLVSATTKRAGVGLRSDVSAIYKCLETAMKVANDKRVSKIVIPLLGSGEGGLSHQISLVTMLFSIKNLIKREIDRSENCINIVIYKKDKNSDPDVSKRSARRMLNLIASLDN